ncbi:hypothetical protein BV898_11358 [Hypsibius exemplaris]|uniref:Uncharacterized protein n=1 Tax=Hypsibius exemplaris TaxID=2072580 RepID=A0A1W0WGQ0_HYPEX|nr:hypothetical protein BV898_11358 [Hypsibius exemplaris]
MSQVVRYIRSKQAAEPSTAFKFGGFHPVLRKRSQQSVDFQAVLLQIQKRHRSHVKVPVLQSIHTGEGGLHGFRGLWC